MVPKESPLAKEIIEDQGFSSDGQIIIAMFPIHRENEAKEKGMGQIAPFSCRNYYKETINRMKLIVKQVAPQLTKKQYRLFSNSRLPEKSLALEAGLGFRGKNSLLINRSIGSRGVLAGMILPGEIKVLEYSPEENDEALSNCGNCRLCEKACPGGAISDEGFCKEKCLQFWTTESGIVPDDIKRNWGSILYGCTICQDICPWNRKIPESRAIDLGALPQGIPLTFLLTAAQEEIKSYFRNSNMGMSWITPRMLQRNAVLCAANEGLSELIPLIEKRLSEAKDPSLEDACRWALKVLKRDQD
ncbi:MAG: hypothetical protein B6241_00225 [Spirochaetaceae bacterium 4572_59]|nr:MAG: hypothetical protein B6241_00225 [Spirochaetaceae bacterium 4572_59]